MPTENPRVNVTLSPSLHNLVADLARMQRISKSSVLRELLEATEPTLAQAVAMMKAAEGMSNAARSRVVEDMERAQAKVGAKHEQMMALAAGITKDLVSEAEAIRGRRPSRAAGGTRSVPPVARAGRKRGGDPLPSKRGVKS